MELRGDRVVLRPPAEADVTRLVELGTHPEVARYHEESDAGFRHAGVDRFLGHHRVVIDPAAANEVE